MTVGIVKYDAAWKADAKGNATQGISNLPDCKKDSNIFRVCMEKFGIRDCGLGTDMYNLRLSDPTKKELEKAMLFLRKQFKNNPDKKYLVAYVFAGHGIQQSGKQFIVVNEFKADTGFYILWGAEGKIRVLAKMYSNTYHIAVFACCREIYDPSSHTGLVGGTKEQAKKQIDDKASAVRKANEAKESEAAELTELREIKIKYDNLMEANEDTKK